MIDKNISSKKLKALFFDEGENKKPISETKVIKITGESYKKLNLYAKIVSEITNGDTGYTEGIECGGALLNYSDRNDGIIRDAYLQYQKVNPSAGNLIDNYKSDTDYLRQRGMSWAGMWHSHGGFDPFHSPSDDGRIKVLHDNNKAAMLCMLKNKPKYHYQKIVRDNKIILRYNRKPSSFVINFDNNGAAKAAATIELHDEVFYTPSIVINKDEYLNDGPCKKYYAEFLVGDGQNPDVKVTDAKLEIIEENNNIMPTLEEMVLEVGEKVRFVEDLRKRNDPGRKLKDFPKYESVLKKYRNQERVKNSDKNVEHVEQIINNEKKPEDPDLPKIIQEQQEPVKREIEHQGLCRTKTYMEKLEEFYDILNYHNDSTDKAIAELCRAYSGKQDRLWNKRFEKGKAIFKKLKKKYLTLEQKNTLENIKRVIENNKYLKRKHPLIYQDLQRRLDSNNSNFYCNLTYWKDKVFDELRSKEKKENYKNLEEKIQNINSSVTSLDNSGKQHKRTFGSYLKSIAKYVSIAALATAMVLLPAKYCSKSHYNSQPSAVYAVKKGDNLWNLSKDYLKKKGISADNNLVYKVVDKVALENGKGKQADYKVGQKDKKNPHLIKPGKKIKFSKKVLDNVKQGG